MKKTFAYLLTLALLTSVAVSASCVIGTGLGESMNPVEIFTEADRAEKATISFSTHSFGLELPWGYARGRNAAREYPIVVNGCWGEGGYFREGTRKEYPAFYLDFNNFYTDADGELLADLIDSMVLAGYRIDKDRIYLTGFSQGGSGSFKLVRGMLAKGKLFAAIIRVAGQSESVLAEGAVRKTSLWYHIGLADDSVRVDVAKATYADLKSRAANAGSGETIVTDTLTGFTRTTKTLAKNGIELVKMSEYQGMGHEPGPCYQDPALFDWLFGQSLALR